MEQPNFLVPVALVAFILVVVACFWLTDARRAVLSTILGGYLFLPHFDGQFEFPMLPSKAMFVSAMVMLGSITFDTARWRSFRPRLVDLPVALLCLTPFVSALDNGLGAKEAVAAAYDAGVSWGGPYLLGRLYLGQPRAARELAIALVVAALLYVPFCLWEGRMSPHLHYFLYGFRAEHFDTVRRLGGFRPSVFMQTGLAVSMFMACGTLSAGWLWRTGAMKAMGGVPLGWMTLVLGVTTVLCRSTGAIVLLAVGIATLELTHRLRTSLAVLALALVPATYCSARISGWYPVTAVAFVGRVLGEQPAGSIEFRFRNERQLVERAMLRPWLGWGRFGRSFVYDEGGGRLTVADSMWIAALGTTGLMGLVAMGLFLAVPPLHLLRSLPARHWADPRVSSAPVLAVAIAIWTIDNLLNAMMSPAYPLMAGSLLSFGVVAQATRTRQPARPTGLPGPPRADQSVDVDPPGSVPPGSRPPVRS